MLRKDKASDKTGEGHVKKERPSHVHTPEGKYDSRFTLRSLEMSYAQNDERTRGFLLDILTSPVV